ncbi:MAG TPA: ABC transporter ATP-binding protein [Bacillota bacterium]
MKRNRAVLMDQTNRALRVDTPLVQVEEASKSFFLGEQEVKALKKVSISFDSGQLVIIKGPSGSGKTTLLNIIGGLDHPDQGAVYYKGKNLKQLSDSALTELRRKEVGFVFQSFALIDFLTAFENVELPLRMMKIKSKERKERAFQCLELVGLGKRAAHRSNELSGGEQQRVGIARALANDPSLILADEPTGKLNQETARHIMELLQRIVREHHKSVCVVTHDPMVCEYADVIYEMNDGEIRREAAHND